jgi:hypothetical protein
MPKNRNKGISFNLTIDEIENDKFSTLETLIHLESLK